MKSHLQSYPCPLQINFFWNLGFLLGIAIILQIITGIFLALHYTSDLNSAYFSLFFLIREVLYGWCLRYFHSSGASFVFLFLFIFGFLQTSLRILHFLKLLIILGIILHTSNKAEALDIKTVSKEKKSRRKNGKKTKKTLKQRKLEYLQNKSLGKKMGLVAACISMDFSLELGGVSPKSVYSHYLWSYIVANSKRRVRIICHRERLWALHKALVSSGFF